MQQFKQLIEEVIHDVPINIHNLMRVNKHYVEYHANLEIQQVPVENHQDYQSDFSWS